MIEHVLAHTLPAAYSLLPAKWVSNEATAMLLAIGLQESRFSYRRQIGGPARGFWQFEAGGGVKGVLGHPTTKEHIAKVLRNLRYPPLITPAAVHAVLEHNDVLAACFARCLLYTLPGRLAGPTQGDLGWDQYVAGWRPGKPHRATWAAFYAQAWGLVRPKS